MYPNKFLLSSLIYRHNRRFSDKKIGYVKEVIERHLCTIIYNRQKRLENLASHSRYSELPGNRLALPKTARFSWLVYNKQVILELDFIQHSQKY
jgi:hypothetical protein